MIYVLAHLSRAIYWLYRPITSQCQHLCTAREKLPKLDKSVFFSSSKKQFSTPKVNVRWKRNQKSLSKMLRCKRCAIKRRQKRKKEKRKKQKEREKKWGSKSFFFFFFFFFLLVRAHLFSLRSRHFFLKMTKLFHVKSQLYALLFPYFTLIVSEFFDFLWLNIHPYPIFGTIFKIAWRS